MAVLMLQRSGVTRPERWGVVQIAGIAVAALGLTLALWCVLAFAFLGRGTPAPFDPPRRLVVRGPYRRVRNPMYLGAAVALGGAALFYRSPPLLGYVALFLLVAAYDEYSRRVRRWRPLWRP
jgi:protein-S-isoprenylcysteine O-methyltransferase Ste14